MRRKALKHRRQNRRLYRVSHRRRPLRRRFERLEDRWLLAVTFQIDGDTLSFDSDAGDSLYLRIPASGQLSYSTDGTNYDLTGFDVSSDTTVTYDENQPVYLTGMVTGGGTFQMTGDVQVTGDLRTLGGGLTLAGSSVTVAEGVLISTSPADGVSGAAGSLALQATRGRATDGTFLAAPSITLNSNSRLQATGNAGDGAISLAADDTFEFIFNFTLANQIDDLFSHTFQAQIDVFQGAEIDGGDVTLTSKSGILNKFSSTPSTADKIGLGVLDFLSGVLDKTALSLPISAIVTDAQAKAELHEGASINSSGSVSVSSSATANSTGEATNFYLRKSNLGFFAFSFAKATTDAQTLIDANARIAAADDVSISASTKTTTSSTALDSRNSVPDATANPNAVGLSAGYNRLDTTVNATVSQGALIESSAGNVTVAAAATDSNTIVVQSNVFRAGIVSLSYAGAHVTSDVKATVDGTIIAGGRHAGDPVTINPFQTAAAIAGQGTTETLDAVDYARSRFAFAANPGYRRGEPLIYRGGLGGAIPGLESDTTYYAIPSSDGMRFFVQLAATSQDAAAGKAISFGQYPTINGIPITNVDTGLSNAILFDFNPGFSEGQTVTVVPAAGQFLGYRNQDGSLAGSLSGTYTAHVVNAQVDGENLYSLQLRDAGGATVLLDDSPYLTTDSGITLRIESFNTDSDSITLNPADVPSGFDGLRNGDAVTYHSALATSVSGLRDGATYYAIVDPTQFLDVSPDSVLSLQLAADAQDAASANPSIDAPTLTWTGVGGQERTTTIEAAVPELGEALFSRTHAFRILASAPATGILTVALADDAPPPAGESPLADGELLMYVGADGTEGTLQSGRLYVAQVIDQSDPAAIQLSLRDAVRLPTLGTLTDSAVAGQAFTIQYVDAGSDNLLTISLDGEGPLTPLAEGGTLVYSGSTIPGFLTDGQPYRVHVVQQSSPALIQVQLTEAWFATSSGLLQDQSGNTFAISGSDPRAATLTLTGPANATLEVGQTLTYVGPDISAAGYLRSGRDYRVATVSSTSSGAFVAELVSDTFQVAGSGTLQGSGQAPSGGSDNFHPLGQSFEILSGDADTGVLTIALRAESEFTAIAEGQWLRFEGESGSGPDGLLSGQLYVAEVVDQTDESAIRIRLRTVPQLVGYGTLIGSGGSYVIHQTEADGTVRLSRIDSAPALVDGDTVAFQGTSVAGDGFLRDGQSYQVSVLDQSDPLNLRIRLGRYLAPTYGSLAGTSGDYSIEDFDPETEVVTLAAMDGGPASPLTEGELLTYRGAAPAETARLRNGQTYVARIVDQTDPAAIRVLLIDPNGPTVSSVSADGRDPAGNALMIAGDLQQPMVPDGTLVTYHQGGAGTRIGGLQDGATYQAVVDAASPTAIRLVAVGGGQPIALSLDQTLTGNGRTYTITGTDGFLHALSIAEDGAAVGVTSVAEGDALLYSAALGQSTGSLVDGQVYYVHLPNPANTSLIQLFTSPQSDAPLNIQTNIRLGELDQAFLSGTAHTLTPVTSAGVNITATLGSTDKLSAAAAVGKEPLFKQLRELGSVAATSILNKFGGAAGRSSAPEAPAAEDFSGLLSATGSALVQIVDNKVVAEVGATAVLKSTAGIIVDAAITENNQALNATTNTQAKPKDSANAAASKGRKLDLAIAFVFNQLTNTATASIEGGAQVDAAGALVVASDVIYPWAAQIQNPNKFNIGKFAKGLFTGTLARSELVNNWTLAAARADQDPGDPLTLAGAVNYVGYNNTSTATIGDGASVNQDPAYRGPEQSVTVSAQTTIHAVNYTGNTQFNLAPADLIKAGRDGGWRGTANTVFGGKDNGAAVGIGAALTYVSMNNTTEATVGGPATRINFGQSASAISQGFDAANDIDTESYAIDLGWNPGFTTGMPVLYDSQGNDAIGGLTSGNTYYVIVDPVNRNQIQLAGSVAAALSKQPIQLKDGGSGSQTLSEQQPSGFHVMANQTVLNVNVGTSGALQDGGSSGDDSLGLGAGGKYGGNGTVAVFVANTATLAQVASGTRVHGNSGSAGTANVQALDTLEQISVVGGAYKGQNLGVGLSGVWNDVTRNTRAVVGDNFDPSVNPPLMPGSSDWNIGGPLNVLASSSGEVISVALSAAVAAAPAAKQQPAGQAAANAPVQTTSRGVQISGDGSYSHVNDVTQAYVNDSGTLAAGSLEVTATDSTILAGFGGSFAIAALSNPKTSTAEHTNVGLAGSYAEVNLDGATSAFIRAAQLSVAGDLSVQAERDNYLGTLTATSSASGTYKSSWEVAGSVSLAFFSGDTQAYLSGVAGDVGGNLEVTATDKTIYVAIGGGAGVGGSAGIGVSFGYISIEHGVAAFGSATRLNVGGDVNLAAAGQADVGSLAVALGIAEGGAWAAGAGNASVNQITTTLDAHVSDQSQIVAGGSSTIAASDSSYLVSVSGSAAVTRQSALAIGAAVGYNLIDNTILAYVDGSTVSAAGGSLAVSVSSSPTLISVAAGGAGADNLAFGGSVTVNSITNTLAAYVNDATVGAAGDLIVTADESAMLIAVAGAVALSGHSSLGGDAAVGAAVAYNYVGQSFDSSDPAFPNGSPAPQSSSQAYIQNSRVDVAGDLRIAAGFQPTAPLPDVTRVAIDGTTGFGFELDLNNAIEVDNQLIAVAVGGAGAASFTLGGALTMAYVRQIIQAYCADCPEVNVGGDLSITAIDDSTIGTGAGGVAIATNHASGIGAGVAYNNIANHLLASVDGSRITADGSLSVVSQESGASTTVAVGGGQADAFALGGAVVVTVVDNSAESHIRDNSMVQASSFLLSSSDDAAIVAGAGQVTFANNGASVGAAVTASNLSSTVLASIEDSSAAATTGGLDVLATSNLAITAGAAGIDLANKFTLGGSVVYNTLTTSTQALIDGGTTQSAGLAVSAINSSTIDTGAGNVSISVDGLGAMGAAVASNHLDNTVGAAIRGATVDSSGSIDVTAKSSPSIVAVAVGISGSVTNERFSLSLLGSGAGNQVTSSTQSEISAGTTVTTSAASGSTSPANVTAVDTSSITAGAGALAFDFDLFEGGVTVAVGASAALNRIEPQADQSLVSARIESATVRTAGDVNVTAAGSSTLTSWAVAGALDASRGKGANFGIAGAGAGSSNTLRGSIEALIEDGAAVTTTGGGVTLAASNTSRSGAVAGGLAVTVDLGGGTGVGADVGAALALNDISLDTLAAILGASVDSGGNAGLNATDSSQIQSAAVGVGGAIAKGKTGAIAFGGAGSGVGNHLRNTTTARIADSNQNGTGTPSQVTSGGDLTMMATVSSSVVGAAGTLAFGIALTTGGAEEEEGSALSVAPAIGVSVVINDVSNSVTAEIASSTVHSGGHVELTSQAAPPDGGYSVRAVTVAGGVAAGGSTGWSVTFAGAGAGSGNTLNNSVVAAIRGGSSVTAAGNVSLSAQDSSTIEANGGGFGLSLGVGKSAIAPAIGAGEAKNSVSNLTQSTIDQAVIQAGGGISVSGTSQPQVSALAFGVEVSLAFGDLGVAAAGSGAAAYNDISNTTIATIQNGSTVTADASGDDAIVVSATDDPDYTARSGSGNLGFSFGGEAAVALAVGVALARNTVTQKKDENDPSADYPTAVASIGSSSGTDSTTATAPFGGVKLTAASDPTATAHSVAVAASIAVSLNPEEPLSIALAGSGASSVNDLTTAVTANVGGGAGIQAGGDVDILAEQTPALDADATGAAASVGAIDAAIAGSVSHSTLDGTISAYVGDDASLAAGSLTVRAAQQRSASGDATASASAVAGSGAILASVDAAKSTATTSGSVSAYTGQHVGLPDGDVVISAVSDTLQSAESLGVTLAYIAAGGNDSTATSNVATSATLGASPVMSVSRTGALVVQATGNDRNAAWAIAGVGGVVAGDGASAKTDNSSTATAGITGGSIHAGQVAILASHSSDYAPAVNSINASIAGASGAEARNNDTTYTTVTIGNGTSINASGLVTIAASNQILQSANPNASDINKGASAYAGAGGVISGDAAGNHASTDGGATVTIGNSVTIHSGTNPFTNAGGISITANGGLDAQDLVLLSTGGLIEGGGTSSTIEATITNSVSIGSAANLATWGNLAAGAFTAANARTSSQANTGGLAGTADAHATTSVNASQSLNVGTGSTLQAFGNVTLTAGNDPAGFTSPAILGDSNAEAYAYGGITIPSAESTTTLTASAVLKIAGDTIIGAGRDVRISAVDGGATGTQSSTSQWNGLGSPTSDSATVHSTTNVTLHGDILAGTFHQLTLTIPDDSSAGTYSQTLIVESSGPAELPLDAIVTNSAEFDGDFSAPEFIQSHFTSSDASLLLPGVSSAAAPVGSFTLGPLLASGGSVTVDGDLQPGSGTISAYFGPKIRVTNESPDYLVLGPIAIPNTTMGQVVINGQSVADNSVNQGLVTRLIAADPADPTAEVTIEQTYASAVGDADTGPALFVTGTISNLGGSVSITNLQGSLGQSATIYGQQVSITAPHGNVAISIPPPAAEYLGTNPYSNWQDTMIWPGGNPSHASTLNADAAVAYVANWWANGSFGSSDDLTRQLVGQWQSADSHDVTPGGNSYVFIGDGVAYDGPDSGGDDSLATNSRLTASASNGARSDAYQISFRPDDGETRGHFPYIPVLSLATSASDYTSASLPPDDAPPAVQARSVSITAATIDLNGRIQTTGVPTDWSVVLPASLAAPLLAYRQQYLEGSQRNPQYVIPLNDLSAVNPGDSRITAMYDAASNQITVSEVSNISTGGVVSLRGAIISTNPNGAIDLQGGVGNVTVNNQTGIPLVIQNIDAGGSGGASQVRIIDTNQPASSNQTLYVYEPGQPIVVRTGPQEATLDQLTVTGTRPGTTVNYQPAAGLRWQWEQTARLKRQSHGTPNSPGWSLDDWQWEGSSQQPWQYFVHKSSEVLGFGGNGGGWTVNDDNISSPPVADDMLTLTDNQGSQARSAWFNTPVTIGDFSLSFTYQASGDRAGDGVAFVFQNAGLNALGTVGGGLGYAGIAGGSAAFQINIYDGLTIGTNFVRDGATGSYHSTGAVDASSGELIHVNLIYDAASRELQEIVSSSFGRSHSRFYNNLDLAEILGSSTAYIGFTGATGGSTSQQTISNFYFQSSATTYFSDPAGQLISGPADPLFQQTITGAVLSSQVIHAEYDRNQASHNSFDWFFHYPTEVSLTLTSSVRADNPIEISFGGVASSANVAINSDAPVRLAGSIQGAHHTSISSGGGISANSNSRIVTLDLDLSATGGIGSRIQPLTLALGGGELNALAGQQGVHLNLNSGATIGVVAAGDGSQGHGDVVLDAAGSLTAAATNDGGPNVTGRNITIHSKLGSIGSPTEPLAIQTHGVELANGGLRDGTITARALGDVAL
ncbi:MAG: hypothetical protein J5I93_00495, partial [Pirellulaceae bacterium]|nr:hypothetical protein [Pirellulaceae bacterium]